jgi:hypothetical protein
MATPAQLMQTLSDATGVPLATIVDLDRKLVKAGLRTKGGRGFNAPQMKPLDAARLLTAVLASPQSNEAASSVERYMQTRVDKERSSETLFAATGLDGLAVLPARHSFVEALAVLIASAANGALAELKVESGSEPFIEVFAFTLATRGRIRIAGLPNQRTASIEYIPAPKSGAKGGAPLGDLEQSRRITAHTIFAVAELLGQENGYDRD